jgi:two-component system sensor histidine kinase KdpD
MPDDSYVAFGDTVADASDHTILVLHGVALEARERRLLDAFATHLGVLRDRQELATQAAAARELEVGSRAGTALLTAVSHHLRTPLAGLRAAVGTLRKQDADLSRADRAQLVGAIDTTTTSLSRMAADLLDISRLHAGTVTAVLGPASGEEAVNAVLDELSARQRVRVVPPLPDVVADVALLERVLAILVGNALRHTDGPVEVVGSAEGPRARIAVVDHGPGVPDDRRATMFEPFQRVGDAGGDALGLGLAVARGLVEAHGGDLTVENTPGGGLTMVVRLTRP